MIPRKDRAPLLLTAGFLLPLVAMSTLWLRHPAHASATESSHVGMYSMADPDGDGEALLEHWGDPKDIHEQRVQIGGMLVFFGAMGALSLRRRAALRRKTRAN
jgi:hypothetical protein